MQDPLCDVKSYSLLYCVGVTSLRRVIGSQQCDVDSGDQEVEPGSSSSAGKVVASCINGHHSWTAGGGVSLRMNGELCIFLLQYWIRCERSLELFTHRWSSKALSWRHFSRGTCCCRRRTTCSRRKFTAWRGTDPLGDILWQKKKCSPHPSSVLMSVCVVCFPGGWRT